MENALVDAADDMIMASIDVGNVTFIQDQEPEAEDEKTIDPEKVIASVSAIAERVERLSVEEGTSIWWQCASPFLPPQK